MRLKIPVKEEGDMATATSLALYLVFLISSCYLAFLKALQILFSLIDRKGKKSPEKIIIEK